MIRIIDLWKKYGDHAVLQGVNLEVYEGETLVILGRSGSGKSVLLRHIIGMEKPDGGMIEINGKLLSSLSGSELYHLTSDMGMLFQAGALFDSMTVAENTAFFLQEHGPRIDLDAKVEEALAMVGLEEAGNLMPSDLSGGMRKRAALARMIVYRPHILLYDEPTTGLDPITAMQINDLILKTQKELKATSIVVTHDLCSTLHIANRIALIDEGKIAYIKEKREFVTIDDPLVQAFLENSIPDGDILVRRKR